MKSDFMMAINQVCHERQLPVETVLEAVEVALASAYKRNYGANQITAKVNTDDGSISMFIEKAIVEEIEDDKNEILLDDALKYDSEAELGGVVQIEEKPDNFGRIAAQTTKQVILQRIREAERDALYNVYAEREGEVVNGTVHKVDSHQVILSLGKVEAVLPRSEQIPTERYTEGQRLRAYVSEVTKTPRGPQIIVSRTHRSMLRSLLEVEVPEIYNGTVEIKAIAREAGYRSKIAVAALQEGVDPVGSCVGMRGVRIQSIVNELGGEKIDVAQWSPDTKVFIANALSPAKVLNVLLQDFDNDKTAMVVVPDKQLSLAIGKEGQNARLAAKLTSWRIDIKSAFEAAQEALSRARDSEAIKALVADRPEVFALASAILSEHSDGVDLGQGELQLLSEAIELVGQAELKIAKEKREAELAKKRASRESASGLDLDLLAEAEAILANTAPVLADADEAEENIAEIDAEAEGEFDLEAVAEQFFGETEGEDEVVAVDDGEPESAESEAEPEPVNIEEPVAMADEAVEEAETVAEEPQSGEEREFIPSILDSIVEEVKPQQAPKKKLNVYTEDAIPEVEEETTKKRSKTKGRTLEYDEDLGQVVVKRKRKRSRAREDWEDLLDEDY